MKSHKAAPRWSFPDSKHHGVPRRKIKSPSQGRFKEPESRCPEPPGGEMASRELHEKETSGNLKKVTVGEGGLHPELRRPPGHR
jgi:hypothetical protein